MKRLFAGLVLALSVLALCTGCCGVCYGDIVDDAFAAEEWTADTTPKWTLTDGVKIGAATSYWTLSEAVDGTDPQGYMYGEFKIDVTDNPNGKLIELAPSPYSSDSLLLKGWDEFSDPVTKMGYIWDSATTLGTGLLEIEQDEDEADDPFLWFDANASRTLNEIDNGVNISIDNGTEQSPNAYGAEFVEWADPDTVHPDDEGTSYVGGWWSYTYSEFDESSEVFSLQFYNIHYVWNGPNTSWDYDHADNQFNYIYLGPWIYKESTDTWEPYGAIEEFYYNGSSSSIANKEGVVCYSGGDRDIRTYLECYELVQMYDFHTHVKIGFYYFDENTVAVWLGGSNEKLMYKFPD